MEYNERVGNFHLKDSVVQVADLYRNDSRVVALYIFGSWAKGRPRANSDIDLAFLLSGDAAAASDDFILAEMTRLSDQLRCRADVVVLNGASAFLRMQVFRKGSLVLEKVPLLHRRFRAESMIEAADFLPFWNRHVNRGLKEWMQRHGG